MSAADPHANFLAKWWNLSYPRGELMGKLSGLPRYIACPQVTKRPTFEFISTEINPNAALVVFPFADDYTFGILQSAFHWEWFKARCSTLKGDFRYTSDTVFDSFPWPQSPDAKAVRAVADAARALRETRARIMTEHGWSLRDLYRAAEKPGRNPLTDAHAALDAAVLAAYGWAAKDDLLTALLALNATVAARIAAGQPVTAPGLPPGTPNPESFISTDCIRPE